MRSTTVHLSYDKIKLLQTCVVIAKSKLPDELQVSVQGLQETLQTAKEDAALFS